MADFHSELDGYYEQISNRSTTKGGSSNLTGALGAQPGTNSTAAGGTEIIPVSSDIDAAGEIETKHGTINAYNSSPEARTSQYLPGSESSHILNYASDTFEQTQDISEFTLSNSPLFAVLGVVSGTSGFDFPNAAVDSSGAGYVILENGITWASGTYTLEEARDDSKVPLSGNDFTVNYTYFTISTATPNYNTERARIGNNMPDANTGNSGLGPEIFR